MVPALELRLDPPSGSVLQSAMPSCSSNSSNKCSGKATSSVVANVKPPTKDAGKDESKTAKRGDPQPNMATLRPKTRGPDKPPQKTGTDNAASQATTKNAAKDAKLVDRPPPVGPGKCVPVPGMPCTTPTLPAAPTGLPPFKNVGAPNIPDFGRWMDAALPCPQGFAQTGVTFYGGTQCSPISNADIQKLDDSSKPSLPPAATTPSQAASATPAPSSDGKQWTTAMLNKVFEKEIQKLIMEQDKNDFFEGEARRAQDKREIREDVKNFFEKETGH